MGRCIDHQKRRDLLRTHNRVHIQDPDMLRYQKYAYYCIAFDKHSCNRPISYQLDIPFFKDKNKFFQHRYNTCYWFQFGWLKIKWIYAVFPISITLISHRLKYPGLSNFLLKIWCFILALLSIHACWSFWQFQFPFSQVQDKQPSVFLLPAGTISPSDVQLHSCCWTQLVPSLSRIYPSGQ